MLLHRVVQDSCPGCGSDLHESTDARLAARWDVKHIKCYACEARDSVAKRETEDDKDSPGSHRFMVYLKPERKT